MVTVRAAEEQACGHEAGIEASYKQSEVGLIPSDWEVRPLGDLISSLQAGVSVNSVETGKSSVTHDSHILKTSCVFGGEFDPHKRKTIATRDISRAKVNPKRDTIIVSRMNTPELVGECGYVSKDYPDLYLPDRLWMTSHSSRVPHSVMWLAYLLSSKTYNRIIKNSATGTSGSMKNISKSSLLSVPIPFPPDQQEQEGIAGALSDTDDLIESLEQLIEKKRLIKQGAMQELLSGRRRLPGFSKEWDECTFGNLALPRKQRINPRVAGRQPFCVELENIGQGTGKLEGFSEAGEMASLKGAFCKGDVLFGKLRAYLRKYWLADRDGVCSTEFWVLVPANGKTISGYLFQLVQTDDFINVASMGYGTHMPRSDWTSVAEMPLEVPNLDEQKEIAAVLSDMDDELEALRARLEKAHQTKQGMMQELLTGRVRLI